MRRTSLLLRFAVVSLVLVCALGVLLAQLFASMISARALHSATDAAVLTTVVAIQPLLTPADLKDQIPADKLAALDRAVAGSAGDTRIARIKIWQTDSELLYVADPHTSLPASAVASEPSHELEHALAGEVEAELITASIEPDNLPLLQRYGSLLEVYVPIRYPGHAKPSGVFELYLPYDAVRSAIRTDTLRMVSLLGVALLVLWAALFRTVASASRRLRAESRRNQHQALHDALTGLPNRVMLAQEIERSLREARRGGHSVGLVLLDLDRFREVNDTLGHRHGDDLIREVARRLSARAGPEDTVARLGGDEFAVLLHRVAGAAEAITAVEHLRACLSEPFAVGGLELAVHASAGVSVHPDDASDADTLLQHADVAMYLAKSSHEGLVVYDAALDEHSTDRLQLLAELARGIEGGELVLHYQPKCEISGAVRGVEALVRWQHPERGLLLPADFLPAAEKTGLIHALTEVVLDEAIRQARVWYDAGSPTPVAVNVSTRSLLDGGFADRVLSLLAVHRVPAALLGLEITETTIMADPERALTVLTRLADAGVRLAIDDFGTGYSSLAYLKRLPVHELKIDQSFVSGLTANTRDQVIIDSTVALGKRLGLDVVAEGVEDEDTRRALKSLGCELGQGYFFGRPVAGDELRAGTGLVAVAAIAG